MAEFGFEKRDFRKVLYDWSFTWPFPALITQGQMYTIHWKKL